jgi:hypothetical protein
VKAIGISPQNIHTIPFGEGLAAHLADVQLLSRVVMCLSRWVRGGLEGPVPFL